MHLLVAPELCWRLRATLKPWPPVSLHSRCKSSFAGWIPRSSSREPRKHELNSLRKRPICFKRRFSRDVLFLSTELHSEGLMT